MARPIGARFHHVLPVHKGELPANMRSEEVEEPKATEWSAGGKLLLVEDEDMVRAVAERALVRAGYTVTTAADGEEGLAAMANGDTEFDMIVSDVVMPTMDGPAMARAIRKVKPTSRSCSCRAMPKNSCAMTSISRTCISSRSRSACSRSMRRFPKFWACSEQRG